MGFISDLLQGSTHAKAVPGPDSRAVWREVFGDTAILKEDAKPKPHSRESIAGGGGSWVSSATSDAAFKRLLQAFRSNAPGGWTDDRYAQSNSFNGIVYIAIHRIAEMMSQCEFQVFEKDDNHPDGKRPVKKGSDGWKLIDLLEKPNGSDSFGDLMYQMVQQEMLTGTSLTWMVPNSFGVPFELYEISTAVAIPQPTINPDYPDGFYRIQPLYPYGPFSSYPTPSTSVGAPIPSEWVLKVKYQHPLLRYEGYSPQTALRLHIDEITSIDRSRWYKMKKTFNPNAVMDADGDAGAQPLTEPEIERMRAQFEAGFQGPENVGNLFISQPGYKLSEFGTSPRDMDYQSGWEQLVSFALAGFGITKPAAGMIEDASYASLYATLKQFYWQTLNPKARKYGQKFTRFLAPFFGDNLVVEIRGEKIDDHDILFQKLKLLQEAKAITKGKLLRELDMPPFGDERDDELAGEGGQEAEMQKQQMEMQQQAGGMGENPEAEMPAEMATDMPSPGPLSAGSLGSRMKKLYLNGRNGHGKSRNDHAA